MDAYFDIFSGISGNMILVALFDLGLELEGFKEQLAGLGLDEEFELKVEKTRRQGIAGTLVEVVLLENSKTAPARNLTAIKEIIASSTLSETVKKKSQDIFTCLAQAEAKIHDSSQEEIHFHEVGAVDAIVDIVGSVLGLEMLGIENIRSSRVHTGTGFVDCQHGTLPVPAPATLEILQEVPIYSRGLETELVTPTGAAIIKTLARDFSPRKNMTIKKTGYGAGSKDLSIPNLLRVNLGYFSEEKLERGGREATEVEVLEANIDDMNPEFYDHVMEELFQQGALDVYLTPIQMKKGRPALKLSVLAREKDRNNLLDVILKETTSLGVRIISDISRVCLERKLDLVSTPWGKVAVKIAFRGGEIINVAPEYEDCLEIARENSLPLKKIYQIAVSCFYEQLGERPYN